MKKQEIAKTIKLKKRFIYIIILLINIVCYYFFRNNIQKFKIITFLIFTLFIVIIFLKKTKYYQVKSEIEEDKDVVKKEEYKELEELKRRFMDKIFNFAFAFPILLNIIYPLEIIEKIGIINFEALSFMILCLLGLSSSYYLTEINKKEKAIGCKNNFDNTLVIVVAKMVYAYFISYDLIFIMGFCLSDL